ncbi:MAG: B12-binding domain-containing radical SAM protein [Desulfobacterota bacterium]|nr:B12-binding domain-containing radical SAM protein [Thermodesulfobacteriota bacterium]
MNVLLIYPRIPRTFWSFTYSLKFIKKKAASPPLGLLTVAAMLPREWNKRLVDLNVTNLTDSDLAWADLACISAMAVQRQSAEEVIQRCKAHSTTVVAGGPLFTTEHEKFGQVDHFILNEAELTLPLFLEDFAAGRPQRLYATENFADLTTTPVPLWELADMKQYAELSIQFSRGCPFDCEFCNITALLGRRPRIKTATQIIAELDHACGLGYRGSVFIVDDNFIGNKAYLKQELLPALIRWQEKKPGMTFHTEASINLADDAELMQMMVAAGFDTVFIGIETPDTDSLIECSKLQNKNRDMVADVKKIQRAGLQVQGGFIVGFDHDGPSIFQRQIDFIQKSGIATAMVGLLQAIPGTRLYERLKQEGRLLGEVTGDNVDGTTNVLTRMNLDALRSGYRSMMEHLYAPRNYYTRVMNLLREYKPPVVSMSLTRMHIMAFFRSVIRLGIVGRERLQYWKLLIWTALRRRKLLPVAITLAIYGFHFRKIVRQHIR